MVASKEGNGEDVEMGELTPLATVAEVEQVASNMEVKSKEEFENNKEDEGEEEAKGTWSNTLLQQVGDNKLEWLNFDKKAAGVERRFQRELEAARKELEAARKELEAARKELAAVRAQFTVAKQTLATLENNVGEENWEEGELGGAA
ncbi:hypothetical protein J132_02055 [Termitomyces sp. J132]|nr:hypothetical protein J132_02055 [Termitomyces sp. J132]